MGALSAYHESLDIDREVCAKNPTKTLWQTETVKLLVTLAIAGDDPPGRLTEALAIMNRLKAQGRLQPSHRQWIADIEGRLAKLGPASGPYSLKPSSTLR
jgi:hypothetical protein